MFADLHDPDPPKGDDAQMAEVQKRADRHRRRRATSIGIIAVLALGVGGALALVATTDRGSDRISTLDATPDRPATTVSLPAPPPTVATPSTTDAATDTTVIEQPTATSAPTVPIESSMISIPSCVVVPNTQTWCPSFANLNDGTLISLAPSDDDLVVVYDGVDSNFRLDLSPDRARPWLLAVGPGDIGYVSWVVEGSETTDANVSAFELTGPDAGRLVADLDATVSRAGINVDGDIDYVATERGLVAVGCCDLGATRPVPGTEPTIEWVNADGDVVRGDGIYFSISTADALSVSVDRPGDNADQTWLLPTEIGVPRGMPLLFALDDGTAVYVASEPRDSVSTPYYLRLDGSVEVGDEVPKIRHVLVDGRLITQESLSFSLVDPADTDLVDVAPLPAASIPLVGINSDGDAVYMPDGDQQPPTLIFDGPDPNNDPQIGDGTNIVDRVAFSGAADQAVVGLCCAPVIGTILTGAASELPIGSETPAQEQGTSGLDGYGYAPTSNRSGDRFASITGPRTVAVTDIDGDPLGSLDLPETAGDAWDITWLDDRTILALSRAQVWSRTVITLESDGLVADETFDFATGTEFDDLRFAGTAIEGEVAVHHVGTDRVLSGTLDDYGNLRGEGRGSSLQVITLPDRARSAWFFDPGQLIWVDNDQALRVGERIVPGTYLWARR